MLLFFANADSLPRAVPRCAHGLYLPTNTNCVLTHGSDIYHVCTYVVKRFSVGTYFLSIVICAKTTFAGGWFPMCTRFVRLTHGTTLGEPLPCPAQHAKPLRWPAPQAPPPSSAAPSNLAAAAARAKPSYPYDESGVPVGAWLRLRTCSKPALAMRA